MQRARKVDEEEQAVRRKQEEEKEALRKKKEEEEVRKANRQQISPHCIKTFSSRQVGRVQEIILGGVYMIPARLSFWHEFIPVPTCGSVFVYIIPAQNLILERVIPV